MLSALAFAADRTYVRGTLVDVAVGKRTFGVPQPNGGTLIGQGNLFQVKVQIEDVIYTAETRSGEVRQLIVGDPVEVRLDEKHVYLKCPNGKEVKAKVLTKARAS